MERKTIMVVDDDPGFLEFMSYLLNNERYRLTIHRDATTAMEEIGRQQPDIVILDLAMPEKTGWSVLDELKASSSTSSIPVIICTAAVQEAERRRSVVAAMNVRTMIKPFDVGDLLDLIETILSNRAAVSSLEPAQVSEEVAAPEQIIGGQPDNDASDR